jgi:hypothetical protein
VKVGSQTTTFPDSEEERRGMFPKAKASGMELATLGGRIQSRRAEVAEAIEQA